MAAAAPITTLKPADLARRYGPWVLLMLLALAFGLYGRYGLIENTPVGLMCQSADPAWFCPLREGLIQFNFWNGWSWAAMTGGVLALLFGWRAAIMLGLATGAAGLVLYNAGPAGFGMLLALMRLVRR